MVTFDSRALGTSAEEWALARWLRDAAPIRLDGIRRAVVVAAHPDDETLGAGGLIVTLADAGAEITVVVVTDGAASHPDSLTHTRNEIARLRQEEGIAAIRILAPSAQLVFLGVGDGDTGARRSDIRAGLDEHLAGADLLVAPWRGDGHRDHRLVGEVSGELAAERRIRFLEYPVWMWHWGDPGSADIAALEWVAHPLDSHILGRKEHAISSYASQIDGLGTASGDEQVLSQEFLAHFAGLREVFVETEPLGERYFDELYRRRSDPWRLESRWYERRKRAVTMAALPAERYRSALEIGSSIGMLTADLATRCDHVLSLDISQAAVEQARQRVAGDNSVRIEHRDAVSEFPEGEFDLIVISEVGYYWTRDVLEGVAARAASALSSDGVLVLCHWRHPVENHALSGDEVHEILRSCVALESVVAHEEADFLLDVLGRDTRSVAQREGVIP
jgi:LmbE family N-acetylglucosaminyl deacetylase/precorrin-6B methylase 2